MAKRRIFICLLLILLMAASVALSLRLTSMRREGLPEAYQGYTATEPPALTFILAGLGCARGIAGEILWFRANRLQEEGRYMELVQIADWITRLDPRAVEAWVYNSWNLAYNVSSLVDSPEERLRWVRNGLDLLQNDALRYNPRSAKLYRELAWFYLNKIGDRLDAAHLTYKAYLAKSMAPMLKDDGSVAEGEACREALAKKGLDVDFMRALERECGALDWRSAEAHALYWAKHGMPYAEGVERMQLQRVLYQALLLGFVRGKVVSVEPWHQDMNKALASATEREIKRMVDEYPSSDVKRLYRRFRARYSQDAKGASEEALAGEQEDGSAGQ